MCACVCMRIVYCYNSKTQWMSGKLCLHFFRLLFVFWRWLLLLNFLLFDSRLSFTWSTVFCALYPCNCYFAIANIWLSSSHALKSMHFGVVIQFCIVKSVARLWHHNYVMRQMTADRIQRNCQIPAKNHGKHCFTEQKAQIWVRCVCAGVIMNVVQQCTRTQAISNESTNEGQWWWSKCALVYTYCAVSTLCNYKVCPFELHSVHTYPLQPTIV